MTRHVVFYDDFHKFVHKTYLHYENDLIRMETFLLIRNPQNWLFYIVQSVQ